MSGLKKDFPAVKYNFRFRKYTVVFVNTVVNRIMQTYVNMHRNVSYLLNGT